MTGAVPREAIAWIFDNLLEKPFGILPLANLNIKGGPTVLENYEQVGSYNWLMEDSKDGKSTLIVPGAPRKLQSWNGGRLTKDEGPLLYDINHLMSPKAPMDPMFLALKTIGGSDNSDFNFQQFDLITDSINLVKLFAFSKGAGGGMFRIDLERLGRTIIASRVEACDVVPIDFTSYDLAFRDKCSQPVSQKILGGPYQQMAKYQLGQLKILVRFEPECADFSKLPQGTDVTGSTEPSPTQEFELNKQLQYVTYGKRPERYELLETIAFPQSDGFPEFTYSKLFFTGIDRLLLGSWRGPGDFGPPKPYTMSDMIKVIKPQQAYSQISRTYDCLVKVINLLRKNPEALRISLVWTGSDFLEIYEKVASDRQKSVSDPVRAYLKTQVTEQMPGDVDELDDVDN